MLASPPGVLPCLAHRPSYRYLDKYVESLRREGPELTVESFVIPDGEEHKSMDVIMSIMTKALECRLDRKV